MIKEIAQELVELTKDRKFARNLGLVTLVTVVSSVNLVAGSVSPERTAQKEKLENFSELVSVGLSIRSQTIINK